MPIIVGTDGHCVICHKDYAPNSYHSCGGTPTFCGPGCFDKRHERLAKLEAALNECAAPFKIGSENGIDWEGIAREFNRRQKIAKEALAPVAQEVEAGA